MRIRVRVRTDGRLVRLLQGLLTPKQVSPDPRRRNIAAYGPPRVLPKVNLMEEERDEFHLWLSASRLVQQVHDLSEEFPRDDLHPIRAGLRRTAISVAALLAQAQTKEDVELQLAILGKAQVALAEFEVQIDIAGNRDLLSTEQFRVLFGELVVLSGELSERCRILVEKRVVQRSLVA
jgi:four helix bundle protein